LLLVAPYFITFEGLDGSGKSTHLRLAAAWLKEQGISHCVTQEPGGTDLGGALRRDFLDPRWGSVGTLLFDLPAETARNRGNSPSRRGTPEGVDRLDAEELDFYQRVREGYLELARHQPERFRIIRSTGSPAETEQQVRAVLAELFTKEPAA
jgi:thymidylate kinase